MKPFVLLLTGLFLAGVGAVGALGIVERAGTRLQEQEEQPRRISSAELGRHVHATNCWIAVRGGVYDVTRYIDQHPAPPHTITATCGTDATVAFETKNRNGSHSPGAWHLLETMRVGDYAP
jgi:cytochrome b involved in lipid metabolism